MLYFSIIVFDKRIPLEFPIDIQWVRLAMLSALDDHRQWLTSIRRRRGRRDRQTREVPGHGTKCKPVCRARRELDCISFEEDQKQKKTGDV